MRLKDLGNQIALGEDSTRQFKVDVENAESLGSEMAAFANTGGGTIFIGVADDGSMLGLSQHDVARINQLISNGASQLARSPLAVQTENVALESGRLIIALTVPKGIDKPYVAKGLLPYHGLGSGIKRALDKWPTIDFTDDHDGCLFTAIVNRKPLEELELADKGDLTGQASDLSGQADPINDLLNELRTEPSAGYAALAERLEVSEATVKRNIQKLKQQNRIRRIGSKKTGHWEVIE